MIANLLKPLDEFFSERFESYEFVLVNNSSTDGSLEQIRNIVGSINGNVNIVNMAWKHETELAILAGKDLAIGDFIFEIESVHRDWPFKILDELYSTCQAGYDIVAAAPSTKQKLISRLFYKIFQKTSHFKMDLSTETVRIISRRALNAVIMSKEKVRYHKLLYKLTGFPSTDIVYTSIESHNGRNKPIKDKLKLAVNILINYSSLGLRLALLLSLFFFLVSFIGGVYAMIAYLVYDAIVEGWAPIMLFLSLGFSGLFLLMAIAIKYMSIILLEVQDKPAYKVSGIEAIPKS
jgi:dolichol-phosphate mannosyltransferase